MPSCSFTRPHVPVLQGSLVCATTEGRFWKLQTPSLRLETEEKRHIRACPQHWPGVPRPCLVEVRAQTGSGHAPATY